MSRLDYVLVDLDAVRAAHLIENAIAAGRETINDDQVTKFTWLTFAELAAAGAVLDLELDLPLRQRLATPAWYVRFCHAQGVAVRTGQITENEASAQLAFWHQVCMLLSWPMGWNTGQIRLLRGLE